MTTTFDVPELRPFEVTLLKHKGVELHCQHFASEPEGWTFVDGPSRRPSTSSIETSGRMKFSYSGLSHSREGDRGRYPPSSAQGLRPTHGAIERLSRGGDSRHGTNELLETLPPPPLWRISVVEITSVLVFSFRKVRSAVGTMDECQALYDKVRAHNLLAGWRSYFGIFWTPTERRA